jgi:hypothetical protein
VTGAEHYRRAEQLEQLAVEEPNQLRAELLVHRALVHAVLAATAVGATSAYGPGGLTRYLEEDAAS